MAMLNNQRVTGTKKQLEGRVVHYQIYPSAHHEFLVWEAPLTHPYPILELTGSSSGHEAMGQTFN
jgi:hypothetical protein